MNAPETFTYERWRHGGWYVCNVRYPSGAVGCVSRNYPDKKWRVVGDPRPFEKQPTFKCRDDAARAEWGMANPEAVRLAEELRLCSGVVSAARAFLMRLETLTTDEFPVWRRPRSARAPPGCAEPARRFQPGERWKHGKRLIRAS